MQFTTDQMQFKGNLIIEDKKFIENHTDSHLVAYIFLKKSGLPYFGIQDKYIILCNRKSRISLAHFAMCDLTDLLPFVKHKVVNLWSSDWCVQKMIYYIAAGFLAATGNELCRSDLCAWRDGPVSAKVRAVIADGRKPDARCIEKKDSNLPLDAETIQELVDNIWA
jgi:hypothetical protein